ncbi:WD domain, G-beta repeat [Planctomycetes bacterium Pan216]|uniref:WD domain, G-beta repeat n=1 Tax=Kolteria novifilia TaxID=2527975 RepID=A0A518AZ10_9BACT|nr:WD domain, G-beta repeat [Planctomycetes bacterium Pan216]
MRTRQPLIGVLLVSLLGVVPSALGEEKKTSAGPPNFQDDIKPILREHCLSCHGDDTQEAGINLQSFQALMRGGSAGKIVVAGRASQSILFKAITNEDENARMPPSSPPLADAKIELIHKWIDSGLRASATSKSMVKERDIAFKPVSNAGSKPKGPPAMPENLPDVKVPNVTRPLPVLAMDTSPWAPLLAVSGQGHVKLLRTDSKAEIGRLAFPEGVPHVIRFSRDGSVLMVGGGRPVVSGHVVLFDVKTGKRLAKIGDEVDAVLAADLSPDQRLVALGGSGRTVKVFSTTDGAQKHKLTKHTDWITAIAFSPDGTKLASADRAGGIHLWDAQAGGILLNLAEHKGAVRSLDWRSDGKLLASTGEDGKVIWWDVTDGFPAITKSNAHPPRRTPGTYGEVPNGVLAGRFDREGNLVTAGRDRVVKTWTPKGEQKQAFNIDSGIPISSAVSHDSQVVFGGTSEGEVKSWDVKK